MLVTGLILVLCVGLKVATADYACLCNNAVEAPIYVTMDTSSAIIGHMYEFDCSAEYTQASNLTPGWKAVATNHRIGYIHDTISIDAQTCDGDPDPIDAVTTSASTIPTTTTVRSTRTPQVTTTTLSMITPMSTAKPTTTPSFTVPPTTLPSSTVSSSTTASTTTSTAIPTTVSSSTVASTTVFPNTTPASTVAQTTTVPRSTFTSTAAQTPSTSTYVPTPSTTTKTSTPSTTTKAPTTTGSATVTFAPTVYHNPGLQFCPAKVMFAANYNHGYVRMHAGSCYELIPASFTWQYAENNCVHKGGHLVHISNQDEENFVLQFLQSHGYSHAVWTGLNDRLSEEQFTWTSGDAFVWQNWMPGRKSNFYHHNNEDCVVYVPYINNAHWDDVDCGRTHAWICRYDGGQAATTAHTLLNFIHSIMGREVKGNK